MLSVFRNRDDVDLAFAKTKPRFDCLDDSWTVFLTDRDAILNHLYARTEAVNFWIDIHSHHLVVDPNTQVPLLLEKIEKRTRCGLWRNGNPKRNENNVLVIPTGAQRSGGIPWNYRLVSQRDFSTSLEMTKYLVGNRLRALGADFATTIRAESSREMRPEQFQIIVDLRHGADSRTGALDGVGLFDGDRRGNAANVVHARFVHTVEELPHVGAERLDVTTLAFGVNGLERQTRLAAATRAGDDCQLSKRKIEINTFKVVLARSTNFDAIIPRWRGKALFSPDLRTHWKYSLPVKRFANFCEPRVPRPLRHAPCGILSGGAPQKYELYSLNRAARFFCCCSNSFGTTPPNESKNSLCAAIAFCHSL